MAITGIFSGEFFNTMLGFGMYGLRYNLTYKKPVEFSVFTINSTDHTYGRMIMCFHLVNLI